MKLLPALLLLPALTPVAPAADVPPPGKPHILWISSEDHGQQMGCYGDTFATTPNVDGLAARGMLFKNAWSCGPVCAAARTTLITGVYPPALGGEHMRSQVPVPSGQRLYPQFLRDAGYYCTNNSKTDYNLPEPGRVWDECSGQAHWKNRESGQPFFAVFNSTVSHESQLRARPRPPAHDPAKVRVPAYHPDTPEVRLDWARYYDMVTEADAVAGRHLRELEEAGLAGDTIVFYWGDHGSGMPRSKRWPCDSGLRVPVVVYFPPKWLHLAPKEYAPGAKSDRLVSFVDFAPTLLSLAGVRPPEWMQGHAFAGPFQEESPPFLHGFRGRMDERIDLVRSVTDGRYVYLRNYLPHRSQGQHVAYQFQTATTQVWWRWFSEGKTNDAQSRFWKTPKDPEELYDLRADPDEVHNLAGDPTSAEILEKFRTAQREQARRIRDTGFLAEAELHQRRGEDSPYDLGHDPNRYDFDRIFAAAELASLLRPEAIPELRNRLADHDSGVRYWAASGLLMRGRAGVDAARSELLAALSDASVSVRIPAAEALGLHGSADEVERALAALREAADPVHSGAYASIAALNALDALGEKAAPLRAFLRDMPTRDPKAPARVQEYVPRLQADVLAGLGEKPAGGEVPARQPGKRKAKP